MIDTWEKATKLLESFDDAEMPDIFWPERGVTTEVVIKLAEGLSGVYRVGLAETLALMQIAVLTAEAGQTPDGEG